MTAEEKAQEMIAKFNHITGDDFDVLKRVSKACASICVQEIINEFPHGYEGNFEEKRKQYWNDVLKHLNP